MCWPVGRGMVLSYLVDCKRMECWRGIGLLVVGCVGKLGFPGREMGLVVWYRWLKEGWRCPDEGDLGNED